jgi:hypothetical protein
MLCKMPPNNRLKLTAALQEPYQAASWAYPSREWTKEVMTALTSAAFSSIAR